MGCKWSKPSSLDSEADENNGVGEIESISQTDTAYDKRSCVVDEESSEDLDKYEWRKPSKVPENDGRRHGRLIDDTQSIDKTSLKSWSKSEISRSTKIPGNNHRRYSKLIGENQCIDKTSLKSWSKSEISRSTKIPGNNHRRYSKLIEENQSIDDFDNGNDDEPGSNGNDAFVDIEVDDVEAFNEVFVNQRQKAIDNTSYRSLIESWTPNTLVQLAELIKEFSKGKSIIDRHWIIFYWITYNIKYDTVSYFAKVYDGQTAEGVFESRKGVCAGYGNLYKYLCDYLELPCEIVGGYSKGYGFEDQVDAPTSTDHAWNAVEIYHHWYLIESTWGAGNINENKEFVRTLSTYYFLPRPNEMIYHHLPENERWQLLRNPINMKQYLALPNLRFQYFQYKLEIIRPKNRNIIDLEKNKPYALILIRVPKNVILIADLKLGDEKVEGGHQVIFDKRKRIYSCYFAPASTGKHKTTFYAKYSYTKTELYSAVFDLTLPVHRMPHNPISYPEMSTCFYDLGLKILSPLKTHLIRLNRHKSYAEIVIRTPPDVQLVGKLQTAGVEVACGDRVYYNRMKNVWICQFAPNARKTFDAIIYAKRQHENGNYSSAVSFKVDAINMLLSSFSFPNAQQLFFDLNLKIISPQNRGIISLSNQNSIAEIQIKSPDDVELLGELRNDNDKRIEDCSNLFYDDESKVWICKFSPKEVGMFGALIFAKKKSNPGNYPLVVSFKIDAQRVSNFSYLLNTTQLYYDLNIKAISHTDSKPIELSRQQKFVEISVRTPDDVELLGQLLNSNKVKVPFATQVYYDQHKNIWRCQFAPNEIGIFNAFIMGKRKSESHTYSSVLSYQIEVKHAIQKPTTFPKIWQLFFELGLRIKSPNFTSEAIWHTNKSYAEIQIEAPNDVQLTCDTKFNDQTVQNGSLAQYDHDNECWQLLFAPQEEGDYELYIFAKRISDPNPSLSSVAMFTLNVQNIREPIQFPVTYDQFENAKCQIITPLNGVLKKNSIVWMECIIPDAESVQTMIDSKPIRNDDYENSILQQNITVGSKEVSIVAKYKQDPYYTTLIKYFVK